MKFVILLLAVVISVAYARPQEKYTTKYDNINLDSILSNDRLVENYVNCALDKGKCSADGAELKRVLPEALRTDCAKCNDKQKQATKKVLRFLVEKKRPLFDELTDKYDPDGTFRNKYREEYAKDGITL